MNARQKAKKLKKELDFIKNQPLRDIYRVINVEAEHLRAYKLFPLDVIKKYGEEVIEDEARHELSIEFLKHIRENMIVNVERDKNGYQVNKYSTDIWVAFGRK